MTVEAEGESDRARLGIDGTMGDAQDTWHLYLESVHGQFCRVCGLARASRRHLAGMMIDGRLAMLRSGPGGQP